MKTETSDDILDISEIQDRKRSQSPLAPLKHPEEIQIICNLNKIHAINEEQQYLHDQCRNNPLELTSRIGWEIQLEALSFKEDKLRERNKKLWKALGKKVPINTISPSISIQIKKPANVVKGYRIPAITQFLKQEQLKEIGNKLQDLYDRKDAIFLAIQYTATGIANPEQKQELDEIIALEASLVAHAEDLEMNDIDMERMHSMDTKLKSIKSREEIALEEIKNIRANKELEHELLIEKDESIQASKEEKELTPELEEISPELGLEESEIDTPEETQEMEALNEINDIRDSQDNDMDIDNDFDSDDDVNELDR